MFAEVRREVSRDGHANHTDVQQDMTELCRAQLPSSHAHGIGRWLVPQAPEEPGEDEQCKQ
jgi:hypothetical protein